MKEYQSLVKDIKNGQTLPLYFLQGEESFFIDEVTQALTNYVLPEDQKAFNEHIVYGLESKIEDIIGMAKQFPFGGDKQLIVVKEAQHLGFTKEEDRELLLQYLTNPQMQSILVFNFKHKKLNGNTKLSKQLKKSGFLYNSDSIYDNQIPQWISQLAAGIPLQIDAKSTYLLAEHLGSNLSTLHNEMKKLALILGENGVVNAEVIERHIGISKDFNNFELNRAIGAKNAQKSFGIIQYFEKNPTQNPMILSISMLYNLFSKIALIHVQKDKSDANLGQVLKLGRNFYALNEYKTAASNYSLKEATKALEDLLEIDLKSKGVGTTASNDPQILREFVYKRIYGYME